MQKQNEVGDTQQEPAITEKKQFDLFGNEVIRDPLLRDRFMEPPFSVLDSMGGKWQARKREWKALGIESHLGRDVGCMPKWGNGELDENGLDKFGRKPMTETSIFDPALCELIYNWYCPDGGSILDPFAGGSVRGIVANYLGYNYTGIDIREEQVVANREQAKRLFPKGGEPTWIVGDSNMVLDTISGGVTNKPKPIVPITPITKYGEVWIKREDLFLACGAGGAKARGAYFLVRDAVARGFTTITTAGSRKSPQINIIAKICKQLNLRFVAHTPEGELGDDLLEAQRLGAEIIQHRAGYNNVIISRARDWAAENNAFEVPFGMMCHEAVNQTKTQVQSIPLGVKRIVIPVGSGVNLCGLLWGLVEAKHNIPVLGVIVGADPTATLNKYAPEGWQDMVRLERSTYDYHEEVKNNIWNGITLDPIYEAKCLPYLEDGDLFWVVGLRSSLNPTRDLFAYNTELEGGSAEITRGEGNAGLAAKKYDLIFSCPPYADLEVYSDLEGDISNKNYDEFLRLYGSIIAKSCKLLKAGGYACFVVGDIRDKRGFYRDFISHTKAAFIKAGLGLYNEAILLQPLGTAMLRAGKIFEAGKKLTKVHENVLIFKKP